MHLHEDFADDDVVVVFEDRAEDHRHSVLLGLHVPEGISGEEGEGFLPKSGTMPDGEKVGCS